MKVAAPFYLIWCQLLSSLRSFHSLFYTIFLPVVLLAVFGLAFGVREGYAAFFVPGMIGVMASNDGIFAVGLVSKEFVRQGVVKEFRHLPISASWIFISFVIVRVLFVTLSNAILIATSWKLFNYIPDGYVIARYFVGAILCFAIYSFIGLAVGFYGVRDNRDHGILSIYYFLGMFLSDTFFDLSSVRPEFDLIGYLFPLKVVLQFMRGSDAALLPIGLWLMGGFIAFLFVVARVRSTRMA